MNWVGLFYRWFIRLPMSVVEFWDEQCHGFAMQTGIYVDS